MISHQPPDSAAQRQAADAGMRDLAARHRKAVLLRRRVHLAQERTAANPHEGGCGVDLNRVQAPNVDTESVVVDRPPRDRVGPGPDREGHAFSAGGRDGGSHVVRVAGKGHGCRGSINGPVPAGAGLVVPVLGRLDEAAYKAMPSQRGRKS